MPRMLIIVSSRLEDGGCRLYLVANEPLNYPRIVNRFSKSQGQRDAGEKGKTCLCSMEKSCSNVDSRKKEMARIVGTRLVPCNLEEIRDSPVVGRYTGKRLQRGTKGEVDWSVGGKNRAYQQEGSECPVHGLLRRPAVALRGIPETGKRNEM